MGKLPARIRASPADVKNFPDANRAIQSNFRKEFEKACVAVGFGTPVKTVSPKGYSYTKYEGLIPHDFRRSAVRNMTRAKVSTPVAMNISGHKTDHIFRRYNITDIDDKKEAAKQVAEYDAKKRKRRRQSEQYKFDASCIKTGQ
jgi:hypothetical protein